jgi:hypothetical protein
VAAPPRGGGVVTAVLLAAGVVAGHVGVLLGGFGGGAARLWGGLGIIAVNYGLRRLLFLDPALGSGEAAWRGLILLGDLTLLLLVAMSAARPVGRPRVEAADLAVAALALVTLALAVADDRLPMIVRLAHWKEEYLYLAAYVLARLNGPAAAARPGPLAGLALAGVAMALWQAVAGPLPIDLAWVRSGHSLLTEGGAQAVAGAHGLGNLAAGYLRPYGFFGNGTDFGVFLAVVGLWSAAARLPVGPCPWPRLLAALLRPVPLACLLGIVVSVVRFTWAVWALGVLSMALLTARGGGGRALRLWGLGSLMAGAAIAFLAVAPFVGGAGSLVGRAFVTGTYQDRLDTQGAVLAALAEHPSWLAIGEGFGANGAAARKFLPPTERPVIEPHSRLLDLVLDGGLGLLVLAVAPLVLAARGGGGGDPQRAALLAFAVSLMICAALLGAKSSLLQALYWGALGMAVTRRAAAPRAAVPCG